ncbi:MAG: sodium:solute symporter family protein [Polyangiaceae bacterium]
MDPFLYVYGIGGLVFAFGLVVAWRQGWVGTSGPGLKNLLGCLGVMLFFAVLQGYLQYAPMEVAAEQPYRGGAEHVLDRGSGLRGHPIDYGIVGIYFVAILAVGTWFGRKQNTTQDFFFGGRRFSWWLIAFSLVATTVGSYSFVKYSNVGFAYGLSSTQTYLNDWIWLPLFVFGWLPIVYFARLVSIPEYFGKRYGRGVRLVATLSILVYLVGYVGVNLFTMGKVVNALVGFPVFWAALIVAVISATYVTSGGQTSVIMTDLLQGVMLLVAGMLVLASGIAHIGGVGDFWAHLPRSHRLAFPNLTGDPVFPTVGIFWQDAIANSAMFYFLNQGIMMRFMAARSLEHSKKATYATLVILMTVAAAVVGGGGWVARALVHAGYLPQGIDPAEAFYVATELVSRPGLFGLVLAALTAALMSTVDTLITAVAAIAVNDVYKLYVREDASDKQMLAVARWTSVTVTIVGVALVPVFMQFDSIYAAHGAFTAAVTPPLVVALLFSVFWPRFSKQAAIAMLLGGLGAVFLSILYPSLITPFAQGVPLGKVGDGLLAGMKQYKFMRACYGVAVSAAIGVLVTLFTRPEPEARRRGLVFGTLRDAAKQGLNITTALAHPRRLDEDAVSEDESLPIVSLSPELAASLGVDAGGRVFLSDTRWYLGGLRATHAVVAIEEAVEGVGLGPALFDVLVHAKRRDRPLRIEREA